MVGAGLSLNAEPLPGVTSRFPTWNELVRAMFDESNPAVLGETHYVWPASMRRLLADRNWIF
jgi:hypothetical protein